MKMKQWPKDGKVVTFQELAEPVRKAILFAYHIERRNENRSVPWTGPNVGEDMLVIDLLPIEKLHRDNLRYSKEEQGVDALDEIIAIAIQLGIEQGRRFLQEKQSTDMSLIDLALKDIQSRLARLQK